MRIVAQGNDPAQAAELTEGGQVRVYFAYDLTMEAVGGLIQQLSPGVLYGSRVMTVDVQGDDMVMLTGVFDDEETLGWQVISEEGVGIGTLGLVVLGAAAGLMVLGRK